ANNGVGYDNKYKFNGKELDEATGMYYYGARYYDPRISIFVSADPLAEQAPSWTPYRYRFNNPIMFTDPTGLFETKAEAKQWAKENDIKTGWFRNHKISQGDDGAWSINNKKGFVSYHRDASISDRPDGVVESLYIDVDRNKATEVNRNPDNLFEVKEGVALWGMASESGLTTEHKRTSILFSLGMEDVFMRSSAGGTGSKWAYEFFSGMS